MEYRSLGSSGLKVSALCMGTMTFGYNKSGPTGSVGVKEAKRQIDQCLDAGVNIIDTANIYSRGASEEIIGEALGKKRGDVLIATKGRFNMGGGPNDGGNSRINLIRACEQSLKRLKTDWVDLYQVHLWDGQTPVEETMEALDTLVRSGKVRYVGCSNFSAWHVMKALAAARERSLQPFVSHQIHYSLESRDAEYELVPLALDQGLGLMIWSPLAGGLLTGKFRRDGKGPKGARHHNLKFHEPPIYDYDRLWAIVDALVAVAESRGVSPAQVALAWLLSRPAVSTVIVGGRTAEQFADNLAAADLKLSAEELARLEKVGRPNLLYPYWHQASVANDRLGAADLSLIGPHLG
ncbi:MAG: aldo/keto reductase [Alphaproteobacteria bacterium]